MFRQMKSHTSQKWIRLLREHLLGSWNCKKIEVEEKYERVWTELRLHIQLVICPFVTHVSVAGSSLSTRFFVIVVVFRAKRKVLPLICPTEEGEKENVPERARRDTACRRQFIKNTYGWNRIECGAQWHSDCRSDLIWCLMCVRCMKFFKKIIIFPFCLPHSRRDAQKSEMWVFNWAAEQPEHTKFNSIILWQMKSFSVNGRITPLTEWEHVHVKRVNAQWKKIHIFFLFSKWILHHCRVFSVCWILAWLKTLSAVCIGKIVECSLSLHLFLNKLFPQEQPIQMIISLVDFRAIFILHLPVHLLS